MSFRERLRTHTLPEGKDFICLQCASPLDPAILSTLTSEVVVPELPPPFPQSSHLLDAFDEIQIDDAIPPPVSLLSSFGGSKSFEQPRALKKKNP